MYSFPFHIDATATFLTISVTVISYSITKGIGVELLSYTVMTTLTYLIELIMAIIKKTEKPKCELSIVAIIVSLLFVIYFFVPTSLF